jgi:hypothetical protein
VPVDGSGRVYVVGSVPLLHPEAQTVKEMLEGWRNQQLCRNLDHETIAGRIRIVQRFVEVTNEFPGRGHRRWLRSSALAFFLCSERAGYMAVRACRWGATSRYDPTIYLIEPRARSSAIFSTL